MSKLTKIAKEMGKEASDTIDKNILEPTYKVLKSFGAPFYLPTMKREWDDHEGLFEKRDLTFSDYISIAGMTISTILVPTIILTAAYHDEIKPALFVAATNLFSGVYEWGRDISYSLDKKKQGEKENDGKNK